MKIRCAAAWGLSLLVASCASNPPPDPLWSAVAALPPGQLPHRGAGATAEQRAATERARAYLSAMLPSTGHAFRERLESEGFKCLGVISNTCVYSRVQTPACDWSTRVTVVVSLHEPMAPSVPLAVSDMDVQALVAVQPGLSRCYTL